MLTAWLFLQVHACVCTVRYIQSQCVSGFLCDFTVYMLMHIYDCMFVCLCVYIKQPLMAIGGGGGPAGVCLSWQQFSIPHSSVIFSTVTSGNPPCKEALSLSLQGSLSFSLLPPPHFSLLVSLFPSLSLYHLLRPFFISELGKSSVNAPPHTPSTLSLFSRSLKVSPQHFPPIFSDRGPLMRHLSQRSKTEHTSFCCHWEFITLLSWSLNVSLRCIFLLY